MSTRGRRSNSPRGTVQDIEKDLVAFPRRILARGYDRTSGEFRLIVMFLSALFESVQNEIH